MPPDPPRGQAIRTQQLLLNSMQLLLSKVVKTLPNLKCFKRQLVSPQHQCLVPHQKRYSLSQIYCFVCQLPSQIEGKGFDQGELQPCHLYQHYQESRMKYIRESFTTQRKVCKLLPTKISNCTHT